MKPCQPLRSVGERMGRDVICGHAQSPRRYKRFGEHGASFPRCASEINDRGGSLSSAVPSLSACAINNRFLRARVRYTRQSEDGLEQARPERVYSYFFPIPATIQIPNLSEVRSVL